MTRAILWKEFREQGTIVFALALMGAGLLAAIGILLEQGDSGRPTDLRSIGIVGRLGLMLLVMTAGVVTGGTLFAGEWEAGTLVFLDRLPGSRFRVWWRKILAGLILAGTGGAALFAVSASLGSLGPPDQLIGWALLTAAVAVASFGWGAFGSAIARSSLAACGLAALCGGGAATIVFPALALTLRVGRHFYEEWRYRYVTDDGTQDVGWAFLATCFTLIVLPLPLSAWVFTKPDRSRYLARAPVPLPRVAGGVRQKVWTARAGRWSFGVRRFLWLSFRQYRVSGLALGAMGLAAGFALLPEGGYPPLVWPALSLVLGVLCGVVGLADEQGSQSYRFWGERRLPVGRVWLVKVLAGGAMTLGAVVMMALPLGLTAAFGGDRGDFTARMFRTGLFAHTGMPDVPRFPILTYLLIWPLYGFTFGHLLALVFRKTIVAGAAAVMVGGTLAVLWLPSLMAGGLHLWQPLMPVAVAFLTARLLAWPWATDRIGTRGPLVRLGVGTAAVLAAAGLGIGWRVAEVPVFAEAEDDLRFAANLPTYDEKQAGRDVRRAVSLFGDLDPKVKDAIPDEGLFTTQNGEFPRDDRPVGRYLDRVHLVFRTGWPAGRPDFDRWVDRMAESKWDEPLYEAAKKPTGVFIDPNEITTYTSLKNLYTLHSLGAVFLARGLQSQSRGDSEAFVRTLDAWLAVVRTVRHDTTTMPYLTGRAMETMAWLALDRWLERLDGRPDLLRRAVQVVRKHEAESAGDETSVRLANQTVLRGAINAPSRWLARHLDFSRPGFQVPHGDEFGQASPESDAETSLAGFAWTVPWEKERLRRVVGANNLPGYEQQIVGWTAGIPGGRELMEWALLSGTASKYTTDVGIVEAPRRAALLKLALRLAEAETGRLPATLDALVPTYLPVVPADPYDKLPFRYRLSAGERIDYQTETGAVLPVQNLPPGRHPETLAAEQMTAVSGVAGGGTCWPLVPGWLSTPFGIDTEEPIPDPEVVARGGVVGGLALVPDAPDPSMPFSGGAPAGGAGGGPGSGAPGSWSPYPLWPWRSESGSESVTVPAGQGVLWSVGPDKVDDRGLACGSGGPYSIRGSLDLIYLVPRRPRAVPQPPKPAGVRP